MSAIFKREWRAYFRHPLGVAPLALLLLFAGGMATLNHMTLGSADFTETLYFLQFLLFIPLPMLPVVARTAKTSAAAEERLLQGLPLSPVKIVLGKYLAALAVFGLFCLALALYPLLLSLFGLWVSGGVYVTLLGFFGLGAALLAFCMCMAGVFRRRVVAAVVGGGVIFLLLVADLFLPLAGGLVAGVVKEISLFSRYTVYCDGVFDLSTLVYDVLIAVFWLLAAIAVRGSRRYGKGGAA